MFSIFLSPLFIQQQLQKSGFGTAEKEPRKDTEKGDHSNVTVGDTRFSVLFGGVGMVEGLSELSVLAGANLKSRHVRHQS